MLNGLLRPGEPMSVADARDVCFMLVRLGRAIPPQKWVTAMIEQDRAARAMAVAPG